MDTDSFIVYIKTDDIYKHIVEDVERRFETSNYKLKCNSIERRLLKRRKSNWINERWISLKIMTKLIELKDKTSSYLADDGSKDKKAKGTKKCAIKWKLRFENHENCLKATQL